MRSRPFNGYPFRLHRNITICSEVGDGSLREEIRVDTSSTVAAQAISAGMDLPYSRLTVSVPS